MKMKPYRSSKVKGKIEAAVKRMDRVLASKIPSDAVQFVQAARNSLQRALDSFKDGEGGGWGGDE